MNILKRLFGIKEKSLRTSIDEFSEEEKRQIRQMHKNGMTRTEIEKKVGATKGAIRYILTKNAKSLKRDYQRKYARERKLEIARKKHMVKPTQEFHELCPACNKSSPLPWEIWVKMQRIVQVSRITNRGFNLQQFLMQNNIVQESPIRESAVFIPATRTEILQRPPEEEPKGGYII